MVKKTLTQGLRGWELKNKGTWTKQRTWKNGTKHILERTRGEEKDMTFLYKLDHDKGYYV